MTQRYDTYKDSGVQWLGEIPGHWGCVPFRRVATVKSNLVHPDEYLEFPQVSPDCIEKNSGRLISWKTVANSNVESDNHRFYKGQIIYSKIRPLLNKVIIAPFDGLCSADMYPIETTTDTKYMQYYMLSNLFLSEVRNVTRDRVKMPKINREELGQISIIVPPKMEQHAIVSYLDDKCGKIDEWIAKKQKEVELLQEMKQRVIADAVTRGLNPDVKMKATNIAWLSEVPEHWEIKPIRAILKESEEKSETGQEELLSLSQYTGVSYKKDAGKVGMFEAESTIGYKKVHPGQFVMNIMLAWNGSYAVSNLDGVISPAYCVFDFISDDDKMYYHYLWRTSAYQGAFKTESRGIIDSRLRLYPNKFLPFPTICPPLSEQHAIVSYVNERTAKIDKMVDNVNREIENLKEYKQRLISDVVTGQIKVC